MAIETNRVLHQPSEGESTPLLSSPKGGGRLKPQAQAQHHRSVQDGAGTDGSITRRRFNQQQHQQQQQQVGAHSIAACVVTVLLIMLSLALVRHFYLFFCHTSSVICIYFILYESV